MRQKKVILHGEEGFAGMRRAGALAAQVLDMIENEVVEGVATETLDKICHDFIRDHGAIPAPLGYKGFPKSTCISINHVVCHGIPGPKRLHDGDILNIDITVILDGWHGDTSRMYGVGTLSIKAKNLMNVCYESLMKAIDVAKPGAKLDDIGDVIQSYVEAHRFSVVRDFTGHGLGREFHTAPSVLHFRTTDHHNASDSQLVLEPGMIFTIEPMINAGHYATKILNDGWTAVTRDKSLSAQYEHSIGITKTGVEIFTLSTSGM